MHTPQSTTRTLTLFHPPPSVTAIQNVQHLSTRMKLSFQNAEVYKTLVRNKPLSLVTKMSLHWGITVFYLFSWSCQFCCIFWPAFGCFTLQTLVEIYFLNVCIHKSYFFVKIMKILRLDSKTLNNFQNTCYKQFL